tara:strand:- start:579 stop:776 length:198 start_codon:yes stop_codon:yes gene_type:complete
MKWNLINMLGIEEKYERIIHLLREIEFANSQLKPQDTGHINTAISWMERRVSTLQDEIKRLKDVS